MSGTVRVASSENVDTLRVLRRKLQHGLERPIDPAFSLPSVRSDVPVGLRKVHVLRDSSAEANSEVLHFKRAQNQPFGIEPYRKEGGWT